MIYRHALVAQDNVHILDMPPDQYETTKRSGKHFREPYETARTICSMCAGFGCSVKSNRKCVCPPYQSIPQFFKTIYTRDADHNSDLSVALLRANKQIRKEAHPIFYRENTFFFRSLSAVVPFLKNRTPESLASIKRIGFHLEIDHYIQRNPVYFNWVCTFREVSCMVGLNLQSLSLKIESRGYRQEWATSGLDWVYSITRIRGLQELHVEFDLGSTEGLSDEKLERVLNGESVNARWLWCWLAPRILADRKEAVEKAAAYLRSDEAARKEDCLFVLHGVRGGGMAWDLREAMRRPRLLREAKVLVEAAS